MGSYLDNELKWWGGIQILPTTATTLADDFIDEAAGTPAKEAFVAFMDQKYAGDVAELNAIYGTSFLSFQDLASALSLPYDWQDMSHVADRNEFIEQIAEAYFSAASAGLKNRDPNHLNLCARFASIAPPGAIRAAARHCDVVTFNDYYLKSDPISNMALRRGRRSALRSVLGGPLPGRLAAGADRKTGRGLDVVWFMSSTPRWAASSWPFERGKARTRRPRRC